MGKILVNQIGFDLDGVIADTGETFVRIACEEYGYCSFTLEDITSFEVEKCIDIPQELVVKIFNDILEDSLATNLKPLPGAQKVLAEMATVSTVHVVTARPVLQPVIDWFDTYFPSSIRENINLVATGDHDDKARYIHQLGLRYFIDDRAMTCKQLAKENIHSIVYSQPWNKNQHTLPMVTSWQEIRELIDFEEEL